LPEGIDYDLLHDAVKRDGYIVYAGLGQAAGTTFRVCTLGALELEVLGGFIESLGRGLAEARLVNAAARLTAEAARAAQVMTGVSAAPSAPAATATGGRRRAAAGG
jgi:aspartate aminotransferase-like enzyme